jgi:predicted phosphodiesterase
MRLLILSDIHANLTALDTSLDACKDRWDRAVCLGDIVGYGPDPNEVIDRIRSLDALTIRGNHDKAVAGLDSAEDFNPIARHAALWTREQLRPENREYLGNLPAGPLALEGMTFVHGALIDEDEYVFTAAQALESLIEPPTPITFFGHTHLQGGFALRENGTQVEALHPRPISGAYFARFNVEPNVNYLLNPGSVGQPRDGDPRAAFCIINGENKVVEFWRMPYDVAAVQTRMKEAGLPEALILRLAFGR